MSRGFPARWYLGYRRAKAADRAAARAMFTRRLHREGATQWLAVGLWKRRMRLEALAEKKVKGR